MDEVSSPAIPATYEEVSSLLEAKLEIPFIRREEIQVAEDSDVVQIEIHQTDIVVGRLTKPIIVFRKDGRPEVPEVIVSNVSSFRNVTPDQVMEYVWGNYSEADRLGYSLIYAKDVQAAQSTLAGWGMVNWNYIHTFRVESGTEVIVINYNGENELIVRDRNAISLIQTVPISNSDRATDFKP